jgi:Probable cobalt transporter subunit (CbtB)
MSSAATSAARQQVVAIPISDTLPWLIGAVVVGLLLYYVVGIDQGATSVFGDNMYVHEFAHDARHFLGFPCH